MPRFESSIQARLDIRWSKLVVPEQSPLGGSVGWVSALSRLATLTAPPTASSAASMAAFAALRTDRPASVSTISCGSDHTLFIVNWASSTLDSTATGLVALFSDPSSDQPAETACSGLSEAPFWSTQRPSQPVAGSGSEERRVGKECRSRWSPY